MEAPYGIARKWESRPLFDRNNDSALTALVKESIVNLRAQYPSEICFDFLAFVIYDLSDMSVMVMSKWLQLRAKQEQEFSLETNLYTRLTDSSYGRQTDIKVWKWKRQPERCF